MSTIRRENHVRVLDGWRGLAILGVLVDHYFSAELINLGRFGVEFFFVLSGRLMADILFVRHTPLRVFFPRRFARVYPALLVFATTLLVVSWLTGAVDVPPLVYLSALTFTINYVAIFWWVSPAIDNLWSLAIEEHSYLLLGLLAAIGRRNRGFPVWWVIVGLIALSIADGVYQTYVWKLRYHNVYWRTDVRAASILISVAFYLWFETRTARPWPLDRSWTPVAFTLAALAINVNVVPDPVKYSVGTLCLAVAVATLGQAPRTVASVLESRWLTAVGVGSFSLYLWQQPFALIPHPALRLASIPLVAGIAWLSYSLVEQPARKALNRLFEPRLPPVGAVPLTEAPDIVRTTP